MEINLNEEKIIRKLKEVLKNSPSHDLSHSLKVAYYCLILLKKYGGNRNSVIPAGLLHDLGRQKKLCGKEHTISSAIQSEKILKECNYTDKEIEEITKIIELHDNPKDHNSSILYDADKLSGFGALGIARSFMHCGEMGESINEGIIMLKKRMPERVSKLNFEYSKYLAKKKNKIVESFLKRLEKDYEY